MDAVLAQANDLFVDAAYEQAEVLYGKASPASVNAAVKHSAALFALQRFEDAFAAATSAARRADAEADPDPRLQCLALYRKGCVLLLLRLLLLGCVVGGG